MSNIDAEDMRPEYDLDALGESVQGKYYKGYHEGSNVVVIEPDLARKFPNVQAVNDVLRKFLELR